MFAFWIECTVNISLLLVTCMKMFKVLRSTTALSASLSSLRCPHYVVTTPSCPRSVHTTPLLRLPLEDDLEKAKQKLTTLSEDPGNEVKLKLYCLFKQVRSVGVAYEHTKSFEFTALLYNYIYSLLYNYFT